MEKTRSCAEANLQALEYAAECYLLPLSLFSRFSRITISEAMHAPRKTKSRFPIGEQNRKAASTKGPVYRFPSLVLSSSGSEGLLSAVPFRRVGTGCTPNGTSKQQCGKELSQYTTANGVCQERWVAHACNAVGNDRCLSSQKKGSDYLACHLFFLYFLQRRKRKRSLIVEGVSLSFA